MTTHPQQSKNNWITPFKFFAEEREALREWAGKIEEQDDQCRSYHQVGGFRRRCIRKHNHPAGWHIDIRAGTWR